MKNNWGGIGYTILINNMKENVMGITDRGVRMMSKK